MLDFTWRKGCSAGGWRSLHGCEQGGLDPAINEAVIRLLSRNGEETVVTQGEACSAMARDSGGLNSSTYLIHTCHTRCAFAKGGMAPQIPNRKDAQASRLAFEKLRAGKECQTKNGHDGA